MSIGNLIPFFVEREKIEKSNLSRHTFSGNFFGLQYLRKLRIRFLRAKSTQLTNCPVEHENNGDEVKFQQQSFVGSFTKGLPHDETGLIQEAEQFKRFRVATHTGDFFSDAQLQVGKTPGRDWRAVNADISIRGWESPASGLTFEMHGPDSHSVTMPPAPPLGSDELTLEMAEVYWLALLRDTSFSEFQAGGSAPILLDAIKHLNALPGLQVGTPTKNKQRLRNTTNTALDPQTIFRGATAGDIIGPYLSQFLLIGTPGHENDSANVENGLIGYGALKIDQKLKSAIANLDHMTTWDVFLDVQDAARVNGTDQFESSTRFITTPRDLATYVHFDALYEAYLNACLILLGFNAPVDPGIQQLNNLFSEPARNARGGKPGNVDGFALFGGPHVLNLVTEVATRALKAVRYQKFNIHCRLRPEALAGWMEAIRSGVPEVSSISDLQRMYDALNAPQDGINLLAQIAEHNGLQNVQAKNEVRPYIREDARDNSGTQTVLLPMAFPEGSPMHPAYGAGHATVAGACVTMLKAFFDTDAVLGRDPNDVDSNGVGTVKIISRAMYDEGGFTPVAYVSQGNSLDDQADSLNNVPLTVGDELNKLAANISIGRDMAGVHYYTDYIDSLIMGEKVAIGVLLEQSLAYEIYPNNVQPSFKLKTFLGQNLEIRNGGLTAGNQIINWCEF
ncbi:vanadium-dependent haloperoxidase [Acaryochloris sp. IP29b_bin.137]|uniref:vanadium-dependent haloperoxidase n=1 Tax=Acaryochloris sp. IP29b_bin.137 TaxID=2969217 RepID=UPI002613C87C|nr:vanadium-dependent haloperoxidase [Acaryochloris sp. IP29b_bin.137]